MLNAEKITPFVNILDISFSHRVERRLSLYHVSVVLPIARDCSLTGAGFHPTVFTSVDLTVVPLFVITD